MRRLAPSYTLIVGILYKKGFSTPFLICTATPETTTILRELHEGYVAYHEGERSIIQKDLNQEYYWLTLSQEATEIVQKCELFQNLH